MSEKIVKKDVVNKNGDENKNGKVLLFFFMNEWPGRLAKNDFVGNGLNNCRSRRNSRRNRM